LILPGWNPTSTPPAAAIEAMSSTPSDLQGLRQRLDDIDDHMQDLLIERAEIVSLVAATKRTGDQPAFQPAREAEIIRRLVGRHRGSFPVANLIRMWREMLAATVSLQSPFSVAVFAPQCSEGLWDLARDHYGSNTPMTAHDAARSVIGAVRGRESAIGVLPMPQADEPDPWWPDLIAAAEDAPRVVARLPFGPCGNARTNGAEALTIGFGSPQKSGVDRTLLALESTGSINRVQISKLLTATGLACTFLASDGCDNRINLIEVEGFVPISDPRIEGLRTRLCGTACRILPMGGYAVPLSRSALHPKD
jgi:chorismate mutase / prephenate dehydratase